MKKSLRGFTLIELLVVVSITSMLASIVFASVNGVRQKAYLARAVQEFNTLQTAIELYRADHDGQYPPDVDRNIPPGLGPYLAGGDMSYWPQAPWPGSVYDWDNWSDLVPPVYQISVRFCPMGGDISSCQFPKEIWAKNFSVNSSAYWCLSGPCVSHKIFVVPGYCINCNVQSDPES